MTRALLRAIAVAIAVAGVVDPAITMSGATRARVAVVSAGSGPLSRAAADRVRDRLVHDLAGPFEIVPHIMSDAAAAIVIGSRYPRADVAAVPDGLPVATVTVQDGAGPDVRIVRLDAPREVPAATAIHVGAVVEGAGVAGRTTHVAVRMAGLEVGRTSHQWTSDRERWRAGIDVVPVGEPPFALHVEATPADDEADPQDNVAETSGGAHSVSRRTSRVRRGRRHSYGVRSKPTRASRSRASASPRAASRRQRGTGCGRMTRASTASTSSSQAAWIGCPPGTSARSIDSCASVAAPSCWCPT
jgi:hypothetical protein